MNTIKPQQFFSYLSKVVATIVDFSYWPYMEEYQFHMYMWNYIPYSDCIFNFPLASCLIGFIQSPPLH